MAAAVPFLTLNRFAHLYENEEPHYEYWFGEAIQKIMPSSLHGSLQMVLGIMLVNGGWRVASEVRLKLSSMAQPVPDLIADVAAIEMPYPTKPFALCVEILSADDNLDRVVRKCAHYLDWGIRNAWIIDPELRRAYVMSLEQPQPVDVSLDKSLTAEPGEPLLLSEVFERMDRMIAR